MEFNFPKQIVKELVHPLLRQGYRDKAEQIAVDNDSTIDDVCATLIEEGIDDYESLKIVYKGARRGPKPKSGSVKFTSKKINLEKETAYCQNRSCPEKGRVHFVEDMITHDKLKFCSVECKKVLMEKNNENG